MMCKCGHPKNKHNTLGCMQTFLLDQKRRNGSTFNARFCKCKLKVFHAFKSPPEQFVSHQMQFKFIAISGDDGRGLK